MIYTGNYKNCNDSRGISISGDRGKTVNYGGPAYSSLAPKYDWWIKWDMFKDCRDPYDMTYFYVEKYYETVLCLLDPKKVYEELDGKILLCYEDPEYFCHRHIVAAWLEKELGIHVPEVKVCGDKLYRFPRPKYIDEILETVIKLHKVNSKVLIKSNSNFNN